LPEPVKGTILAPKPRESGECRIKTTRRIVLRQWERGPLGSGAHD
jgi:hypothetical protein